VVDSLSWNSSSLISWLFDPGKVIQLIFASHTLVVNRGTERYQVDTINKYVFKWLT